MLYYYIGNRPSPTTTKKSLLYIFWWLQWLQGIVFLCKIVREYDQEIPRSQTADKPIAQQGKATQPSQDTRRTNQAKQPALSLFPIKMIAKLEWA